jgi:hypothetical protein
MAAVAEREHVTERRRDHRRRIAVDVALALADSNAGWGDFPRALEHLAAAEQLAGGSLGLRYADRRDSWIERSPARAT